jgi:hypothetical protein
MRRHLLCWIEKIAIVLLVGTIGVGCGPGQGDGSPHKVYVMLGFHSSFYHSWRGDTPDEAGFGTDIRLARFILDELDRANAEGLDARGYWDHDNLFTLETIIPAHAPDIIERLRSRIDAGLDEVVLGAYANGLTGAMTEEELLATVRWASSNPWGSGTRDVFGGHAPILRAQEGMLTTGAIPILQAAGVEAVLLAYSGWPFNAFANFVPPLAPEQRHGVTWLRFHDGGPRIKLLPVMSIGDVLNHISFERWMLDLRELQLNGTVDRDLVLHMNFDTDVDSWVPQDLPPGLGWFPNAGGLREYIEAVNEYEWAEFTTPGEFLARHEPVGEVVIRQDTADGAFDGHASWAEKFPSHDTWTDLEASRLAGERAVAWLATLGDDASELAAEVRARLWEGRESSFFQRLRGLSTTHFGMSTPMLNEERQAVARRVLAGARAHAEATERMSARVASDAIFESPRQEGGFAHIAVVDLRGSEDTGPATALLRLPFLFEEGALPATRLIDSEGERIPHSWVNLEPLGDVLAAELWVVLELEPGELRTLVLDTAPAPVSRAPSTDTRHLANPHLQVSLGETGITSLRMGEWEVGGDDFLAPFISYRVGDKEGDEPRTFFADAFVQEELGDERRQGLARVRLATRIPFETPESDVAAELRIDLTLPDTAPWLVADVDVAYPYTAKRDILHTAQQKLRRYLDQRWVEVGPFPLTPRLEGTRDRPLVVWKHNFLDVMAWFPLSYGQINPRNAELDAFNHQITAGWVAISDRQHGLLVADRADVRTSFAFAPMRLREPDGRQVVSLNPFGTYHGRQLAYDHMGGNGVGTAFTTLLSSALRPNGPSYNGVQERFSLLLAPYAGDAPPAHLRADAAAFFHPPAVLVRTAEGTRLPADLRASVEARRLEIARQRTGPLPVPLAFLANPTDRAVDLVWDPPQDARVTGYEIEWRTDDATEWQRERVGRVDRNRLDGLANGVRHAFRMRALAGDRTSDWTQTLVVEVGPVEMVDLVGGAADAPISLLIRIFWYGLVHLFTTN